MEIIGKAKPRLADVQCSRVQFQPGDRILVRVYQQLSPEQHKRLQRTVEKWAGGVAEVLIINANQMEIQLDRPTLVLPKSPQG